MMQEICFYGRFGQPVAKVVNAIGQYALQRGKHVQIANAFGAYRPGGPTNMVVKIGAEPVRERSANGTKPDVVVVLDNSLFSAIDVTKGLKAGGMVMALGADDTVLGAKGKEVTFVALDSFITAPGVDGATAGIIAGLEKMQIL